MFRSILDRLIYNDCYYAIDDNLTDGNVGARKNRNIRDNLFVLNAVINSVIHGKEKPIQVQVQDAEKCFDKLWLQATTNALHGPTQQSAPVASGPPHNSSFTRHTSKLKILNKLEGIHIFSRVVGAAVVVASVFEHMLLLQKRLVPQ